MNANRSNQKRAFSDVVSIDAWHVDFEKGRGKAALHADVVFGEAAVGGEVESPIRFRLSVKRAELVVIVPQTEPVFIDPNSVRRDGTPTGKGKFTRTVESSRSHSVSAGANIHINHVGLGGEAHAGGHSAVTGVTKEKAVLAKALTEHTVTQSKTADGDYRWIIEMANGTPLSGRAWDAVKEPRLKLVDGRTNKSIEPTVRLEVRCRSEDLEITDLEVKDNDIWTKASSRFGIKNRMAAAIAFIKARLASEGLEAINIEDKFGKVTLAQIAAEMRRPPFKIS